MFNPEQLNQISSLLASAQTILVIYPVGASVDQEATALALYQGLTQLGKQVSLFSPHQPSVNYNNLLGAEATLYQLGNKDLHVIFDYTPEKVDKVSYHIDEERNKFLLVVQPQKGQPPLDANNVQFEYAGAEADLIFLVGVKDYEQLDQLYVGFEQLYQDATTVSLNSFAATLAAINLDASGTAALAEAVIPLLEKLEITIQDDIATNLLSGIETATDGFKSFTTTANTFESVAKLLKNGARRLRRLEEVSKNNNTAMFSRSLKSQPTLVKKNKKENRNLPEVGGLNYDPGISNK